MCACSTRRPTCIGFGDYTALAEFLYRCVIQTITNDLPNEIDHLARYDEAKARIQDMIEMPDGQISSLVTFIRQNGGTLSKKRRRKDFESMLDHEVSEVEAIVRDAFDIEEPHQDEEPDEGTTFRR